MSESEREGSSLPRTLMTMSRRLGRSVGLSSEGLKVEVNSAGCQISTFERPLLRNKNVQLPSAITIQNSGLFQSRIKILFPPTEH